MVIVLVVFALKNSRQVSVDLFFVKPEISLALLIIICAIIGAIIGATGLAIRSISITNENRKLIKLLNKNESELTDLRAKLSLVESEQRTVERNSSDIYEK